MSTRISMYVDGFNLYHGLHDATGRRDLWLDLESLAHSLLRPGQELVAVHYFTALVQGSGALRRQETYLAALEGHGNCTTVHVGRFQHKPAQCRFCGKSWVSYEEKESDVALAVQAVADVAQQLTDQAWFLSGDSDMIPSVRTIKRLDPNVRAVAVFPPRRSSVELGQVVDGRLRLFDKTPRKHQLPKSVWNASRAENLPRPAYWQ